MLLCLDVGNTDLYGGVFANGILQFNFRYPTHIEFTEDTLGLFILYILQKNNIHQDSIQGIMLGSVVPNLDSIIVLCCQKLFDIEPLQLKPGIKTGIKLAIKNPSELGADRVANAVGVASQFYGESAIIIDLGTATTICCVSNNSTYMGGLIMSGVGSSMLSLAKQTARLSMIQIKKPASLLGTATEEQCQSGLYYGHLGSLKQILTDLKKTVFKGKKPLVIGTGGYMHLFKDEAIFDQTLPNLVLDGLASIWERNQHDL